MLIARGTEKVNFHELNSQNIVKKFNQVEHNNNINVMGYKYYRSALAEHKGKNSKMDKSSGAPRRFNVEEINTSRPKDPRNGRDCPRGFDQLLEELEGVRTVPKIRAETEHIEFEAETSSMIEHIIRIMNETEKSMIMNWEGSDPNLEYSIMEVLEGVVVQTSLELEEHLGWRLCMIDRIGGAGTLREVWLRLKSLRQVVGIKRKLSDSSISSDLSQEERVELRDAFKKKSKLWDIVPKFSDPSPP